MRLLVQLGLLCGLLGGSTACVSSPRGARDDMTTERAAPLQYDALRALFVDVYVPTYPGLDDGPAEFFRANGVYERNSGRAVAFLGRFEVRDGAVCVWGDGFASLCRQIRANDDGTYTFIDTADGSSAVMTITPLRGAGRNMTSEPAAPLQDGEIRALLVDATVAADRGGDDGPFELFLANGVYQRGSGWGMTFEGLFEIRGGAVCVSGEASASRCRRIRPNPDGTYTFTDTANGSSTVMTIIRPQGARENMMRETAAPLQDDALRALFVDVYVSAHRGGDDGPGEFFRGNGTYQRAGGRGAIVFQGRFEIRDGAVCVQGEGLAPVCRRVVANGDGTYAFTNTADGTSAVMTIIQPR